MPSLPTRAELAKRLASFTRRYRMLVALVFGSWLLMAAAAGVAVLAGYQATFGGWVSIVVIGGMFVVIFGGAGLLDYRRRAIALDEKLLCPSCGTSLVDLNGKLALTTGRCAGCGSPVVSDV